MAIKTKKIFKIEHLDPLGQGVSKLDDQVLFISKTLPGEEGSAWLENKKTRLFFGSLEDPDELKTSSKLRVPAQCPHFNQCNGCSYLHTDYKNEIKFKKEALKKHFQKIEFECELEFFPADNRFAYRNRIQLHYDNNKIGFKNIDNEIIDVNHCLLPIPSVKHQMDELYKTKSWQKQRIKKGHVEIYDRNGEIKITWNQAYAAEGFTQINKQMNEKLLNYINTILPQNIDNIVDLFSGAGNFSNQLKAKKKILVDFFTKPSCEKNFIKCNLLVKKNVEKLSKKLRSQVDKIDLLILDPPRKGFKDIDVIIKNTDVEYILYISCHPATMSRDIANISPFSIVKLAIFDFFPSTYHFETVALLKKVK